MLGANANKYKFLKKGAESTCSHVELRCPFQIIIIIILIIITTDTDTNFITKIKGINKKTCRG